MTNYDRIKAMSVEEMADFFAYMFDCNLCSEQQRLSDNPLLEDERCDNNCMLKTSCGTSMRASLKWALRK